MYFLLVKQLFLIQYVFMHQVLLYSSLIIAIFALFIGFYACGRVAKVFSATKDLDWKDRDWETHIVLKKVV